MSVPSKQPNAPLSIRLAESVVFLRGSNDSANARRRSAHSDAPPAMLRGLLTLHLSKATRISSIEVLLEAKSTIQWPEGSGPRRLEVPEEHTFLSTKTVFFDAKSCPSSNRSASVGPASRGLDEDALFPFHQRSLPLRASFDCSLHPTANGAPPSSPERRNSSSESRWQVHPIAQDIPQTLSPTYLTTPPVSPPYTPTSAILELPVVSRPETPSEFRPERSHHRGRSSRSEENPGQMLEEFRNALRMEIENTIRPEVSRTSNTAPPTPESTTESSFSNQMRLTTTPPRCESAPGSRSPSRDPDHRHSQHSSTSAPRSSFQHRRTASPPPSPAPTTPPAFLRSLHQVHSHVSYDLDLDNSHSRAKRSSPRWSLTNMSIVAKDLLRSVSKEPEPRRGRTPERRDINDHQVDFIVTMEEGERKHREKERKSTLGKLTAAVGLDEPSGVENWKEFRRGTYTYPVSFAIPATSPPTVHCDYGAVRYHLKAVVHRPGALTPKLVTTREATVVSSPSEDDAEETHSIIVERQWDDQLRYLIALSGRSFVIGSQVPFNLTLIPMEKCKIYKLAVFLEEKTEYHFLQRHVEQPVKRFELLSVKHPDKNPRPILPLSPESVPLLRPYLDTSALSSTEDEALSSLMGPGPWALTHGLQLPAECGKIHFTYKHKGSHICISHTLKIVFRVERGDDKCVDPKTGRRRMFDIVVQTPIHILSCHCNPEWTSLPRYSLFESATTEYPPSTSGRSCACSGSIASPLVTFSRYQASPASTPGNSRPTTAEPRFGGNAPIFGVADSALTTAQATRLADNSHQFARLVSGQESVFGQAPPQYQEMI
ncbi:hypothetical protein JB92DRAFT_2828728 [Gautieria morchelliformis]|nr:hypothetical protein JB92DRAFT_2828728 [Gautieria morchelliformis]